MYIYIYIYIYHIYIYTYIYVYEIRIKKIYKKNKKGKLGEIKIDTNKMAKKLSIDNRIEWM